MDKLIVSDRGEAQITNDGATILKLLDIVHPAARTLVDIARAQDAEVGDGTTSVVLLAAQLLKEVRGYIEEGVSPHIIMKGFRKAAQPASAINTGKLISRCALGRRTIWTADRCHSRPVRPRRGVTHPRRPASTRMAGNRVTAARNAIPIETASAGPTLVNAGRRVNTMPRKVMATVAADAAMTLPMELSAFCTAWSESAPDRMYSW